MARSLARRDRCPAGASVDEHVYRSLIVGHLRPGLGHHRLDRLQPEHLEILYGQMLAGGLAPSTVLQVHRVLSRALKVAMQRGKVSRNVATLVDAPSVARVEVEPLSANEARRVLTAAADVRNSARWSVALALGLRQGEALGLKWDDIDLDAGDVGCTAGAAAAALESRLRVA